MWMGWVVMCLLVPLFHPGAWALEPVRMNAILSATETRGADDGNWSFTWSFDGAWRALTDSNRLDVTLNSNYARSERARLDRLRTGFRWLDKDYGEDKGRWYPVYLLQTEGDHSINSLHTLVAAGFRQEHGYGYLEVTAGASRDVRAADTWTGDVGLEFSYEREILDRWTVRTGPKAEYGALGSARLRGDRIRYSWDFNLTYQATDRLGIGYRLWTGNTVPNSDRTQWIGLTYRYRR